MLRFLCTRLAAMVATVLGVAMAVSLILTALPGDAARLVVGTEASAERYEAVRKALRLDEPWPARFGRWLWNAFHGELGTSFRYPAFPVSELLRRGLAVTFPIAAVVTLLSFVIGVIIGVICAAWPGSILDLLLSTSSQTFLAIPEFWLGILLIGLFSVRLGWFPAGGFPGWKDNGIVYLILPIFALVLPRIAYFSRLTRAMMADVLSADFVRLARAKGLSEGRVLFRHALSNALIPLVAGLGLTFARLLGGALVIEQVFSLPGLGKLAIEAAFGRDIPLLLGLSVLVTGAVAAVSTAADLSYALLDPRIRQT